MFNRIIALTTALLLCVAFAPSEATAQGLSKREKNQVKRALRQLNNLPNRNSPSAKIRRLTLRLTNLNPRKATQYYRISLRKFRPNVLVRDGENLGIRVIEVVSESNDRLARRQIRQINRNVENLIPQPTPFPTPTPTPAPTPTPTPVPTPTPPYNAMHDVPGSLEAA